MQLSRTPPSGVVRCAIALVLAGACSGPAPSESTEADIDSEDLRPVGTVTDAHVFASADGSRLLVHFGRGAPTISIRGRLGDAPTVLTAPSDGRPYEGDGRRAVIAGDQLRLDLSDGPRRTCTRQTKG